MDSPLIDLYESSVDPSSQTTSPLVEVNPGMSSDLLGKDQVEKSITTTRSQLLGKGAGKPSGGTEKGQSSKRDRLQRDSSMDGQDEELNSSQEKDPIKSTSCPDYFGVRSYLHHFYDARGVYKDPNLYEDSSDTMRLLYPGSRSHRHGCTATWWKTFVLIGSSLLLIGIVAVLLGYLLPQKTTIVGRVGVNKVLVDRDAIDYNQNLNQNLDICKIVGLILFCMGGLTLAIALMIPSFLYRYCEDDDDDWGREAAFAVRAGDVAPPRSTKCAPTSPPSSAEVVPASSRLTEIQPARKVDETMLSVGDEYIGSVPPVYQGF